MQDPAVADPSPDGRPPSGLRVRVASALVRPRDSGAAETFEGRYIRGWVELAILAAASAFVTFLTFSLILGSIDLYFTADAAHYVGDADALMGHGVREIRHPLLFPALLAVFQPLVGGIGAFQLSVGVSLFLLVVSLYLMFRQYLSPVPSLAGAMLGALTPPTAELLGWGGASTLLAIDLMLFALAFLEVWIRNGGRWGLAFGGFLGLVSLTHPFVFSVAVFLVLVRWGFHVLSRRSFDSGWGPTGLRGVASSAGICAATLLVSVNYYLILKVPGQSGAADFTLPWTLLTWSVRESFFLLFFLFLGLLLPLPRGAGNLLVVVSSVGLVFLAVPLVASWDVSYSSRVVYLLPIIFGAGAGLLVDLVLADFRSLGTLRRLEAPTVAAILLSAAVVAPFGLGYANRLGFALPYYQRVHSDDLPAFNFLREGTGRVAVSWPGAFQDEGSVDAWFVEGLSKRPALGPGAPWLSTLTTVGSAELDMQRLFAGSVGLENGIMQIAGGRTGSLEDPAVNVNVSGFYYPMVYLNSYANTYPIPVEEGVNVTLAGNALVVRHNGTQGNAELIQESRLGPDGVNVNFSIVGDVVTSLPWDVWVWPAYFRQWQDVAPDGTGIRTLTFYRDASITAIILPMTAGTVVRYYDAEPRWGIQAIELRANGTGSFGFQISVKGGGSVGPIHTFDEGDLLAQYGITDVLLWKDTGWEPRFRNSARFERVFETPRLLVYRTLP